jgi:hypothetical protein
MDAAIPLLIVFGIVAWNCEREAVSDRAVSLEVVPPKSPSAPVTSLPMKLVVFPAKEEVYDSKFLDVDLLKEPVNEAIPAEKDIKNAFAEKTAPLNVVNMALRVLVTPFETVPVNADIDPLKNIAVALVNPPPMGSVEALAFLDVALVTDPVNGDMDAMKFMALTPVLATVPANVDIAAETGRITLLLTVPANAAMEA